ncbi:MAG: hypothetical protein ACI3YA_02400 [Alloprevotella sp.]
MKRLNSVVDKGLVYQHISMKVKLKMIKDGIKNVDARDISFRGDLSSASIKLIDENGNEVETLSVKSEDILKLKKLLTGSEGDTEEIVFETELCNPELAHQWYEQACKFTPYYTGGIYTGASSVKKERKETIETSEETPSFDNDVKSELEKVKEFDLES